MTDTPETDHLEINLGNAAHPVLSSFCRTLERERDEAREHLKEIEEYGTEEINAAVELRQKLATALVERDEARKTVESLTTTSFDLLASLERTREEIEMMGIRYAAAEMHHETNMQAVTKERDEAREQQDRLAEALQEMQYDRSDKAIKMANELLQSLTMKHND